jgi:hypothetical protein
MAAYFTIDATEYLVPEGGLQRERIFIGGEVQRTVNGTLRAAVLGSKDRISVQLDPATTPAELVTLLAAVADMAVVTLAGTAFPSSISARCVGIEWTDVPDDTQIGIWHVPTLTFEQV